LRYVDRFEYDFAQVLDTITVFQLNEPSGIGRVEYCVEIIRPIRQNRTIQTQPGRALVLGEKKGNKNLEIPNLLRYNSWSHLARLSHHIGHQAVFQFIVLHDRSE
jgi:hypothetical protein